MLERYSYTRAIAAHEYATTTVPNSFAVAITMSLFQTDLDASATVLRPTFLRFLFVRQYANLNFDSCDWMDLFGFFY